MSEDIVERLEAHMGKADIGDVLPDCREAAKEIRSLRAKLDVAVKALEWYRNHVSECRKIGGQGDQSRQALDHDGGTRARTALAAIKEGE